MIVVYVSKFMLYINIGTIQDRSLKRNVLNNLCLQLNCSITLSSIQVSHVAKGVHSNLVNDQSKHLIFELFSRLLSILFTIKLNLFMQLVKIFTEVGLLL
jgi:hypothetical protein